jgi:hypothetical protein
VVTQGTRHDQVLLGGAGAKVVGVTVMSNTLRPSNNGVYARYDQAVVLKKGVIAAAVEDAVTLGDVVKYNTTTGQFGDSAGQECVGATYLTGGAAGAIIAIEIEDGFGDAPAP